MTKSSSLQSMYKIKLFSSSSDKDFIKALKIYNDTIPAEIKTSTNEITTYVDKKAILIEICIFLDYILTMKLLDMLKVDILKSPKLL